MPRTLDAATIAALQDPVIRWVVIVRIETPSLTLLMTSGDNDLTYNSETYTPGTLGNISPVTEGGLQDSAIELQLRTKGFVVVLPFVLRSGRRDVAGGRLALDAEFVVRLLMNPQVNAAVTGAQRNIYSAIAAAATSILSWTPATAGDRKFETSDEWLQLTTQDPGLVAYDLFFTKLSTIP